MCFSRDFAIFFFISQKLLLLVFYFSTICLFLSFFSDVIFFLINLFILVITLWPLQLLSFQGHLKKKKFCWNVYRRDALFWELVNQTSHAPKLWCRDLRLCCFGGIFNRRLLSVATYKSALSMNTSILPGHRLRNKTDAKSFRSDLSDISQLMLFCCWCSCLEPGVWALG